MTGGSRGVGAAIVERLAADGGDVDFSHRTDDDAALAVAAQARSYRGTVSGRARRHGRRGAGTPLGRSGTPAEVAGFVAFPLGSDRTWNSGQTLRAGGGIA